ncbi:MAG TPA: imidazole glycerol phosphate synthase subunit HisH [Sphingomicrobium sp.]|nr:imidazole glycerol phosphate synthase subunit HisH [Sphingomicrobium sp.]
MKLVIVDLGCGNVGSVRLAFGRFGLEPIVTADAEEISSADRVILPGVGAAGFAMQQIDALALRETLTRLRQPALGICLGMQLLFEQSDEASTSCLGLIPGRVHSLEPRAGHPVPHMGWTRISANVADIGLADGDYVYFAHSFACDAGPAAVATADYTRTFAAAVRKDNWLGAQFHPERSGAAGARFLESFLS